MSKVAVTVGGHTFEVEVDLNQRHNSEISVHIDGAPRHVSVPDLDAPIDQMEWIIVDHRPREIVIDPDLRWIRDDTGLHFLEVRDLEARVMRPVSRDGRVKAPIPGLIKTLFITEGDWVEVGQPIIVLEAMKMENEIHAPKSGIVTQVNVRPGQDVTLHEVLAEIS
jgi:biotin carboxyl carrier protein